VVGMSGLGGRLARRTTALACPAFFQFGLGLSQKLLLLAAAVTPNGARHVRHQVGGGGAATFPAHCAERFPHSVGGAEVLEWRFVAGTFLRGHKVSVPNLLQRVKIRDTVLVHGSIREADPMDELQARMLGALRKRHEDKIRQDAEHIYEYAGYLLARIEAGNGASASHYGWDIAAHAREIVSRFSALEAIEDAASILETEETS
jgi:hypothetical protein